MRYGGNTVGRLVTLYMQYSGNIVHTDWQIRGAGPVTASVLDAAVESREAVEGARARARVCVCVYACVSACMRAFVSCVCAILSACVRLCV